MLERLIFCVTACAVFFMLHCANLSGGGSEAGNARITGIVLNTQGSPVSNVKVTVLPSDFDPVKSSPLPGSDFDTTGTDGMFGITVEKGQTYTIQAVHISTRSRALITGVAVDDTNIASPPCTLNAPGAVKVMLPDSADKMLGYVYVPGTSILSFLNNAAGSLVLDSVPAGVIPEVSYSSTSISASAVIRHQVQVIPGDTAIVYNPSWKYARRLFFNTAASGAQVSGDVYNFPVLVRLSSGNFAFAQAKADGSDIRFTKNDGTSLPFEIERWDPVTELAEVWVKVDTIRGNDSSQYISMYWGDPSASTESRGAAVFDSSSGFEGVWHLNETSGSRASDASHNRFTGTYKGGLPKNVNSPSGIGQYIARPDSDYVDIGNVINPGMQNISIGVWVKRAAFGTNQAVVAKTNGDGPSATYGYLFSIDLYNYSHFYLVSGGSNFGDDGAFDIAGNLALTDSTTWHYVFVAIDRSDNNRCKMYVDGVDRTGAIQGNVSRVANVANTLRLRIGTENDNNYSYKGAVAEATIAFTARSADWVKLAFMNQKEQDALVKW
jgi:hypothetical protein